MIVRVNVILLCTHARTHAHTHPLQYMHLHDYMKGKSQSYGPAGVLGSGAVVRDTQRSLHLRPSEQEEEKQHADRVRALQPCNHPMHHAPCTPHDHPQGDSPQKGAGAHGL